MNTPSNIYERFVPSDSIDWSNLAWQTIRGMSEVEHLQLGCDFEIESCFRITMAAPTDVNCSFHNPATEILADEPSAEFFQKVRLAQHRWRRNITRTLHWNSTRWHREVRSVSPVMRQLLYLGVLVVSGKHVHPNRWRQYLAQTSLSRQLTVGERFGRLTVAEIVNQNLCYCDCSCGSKKNLKVTRHLRSGRTKSCGCLRDEIQQRQTLRRDRRRWIQTGKL